MSIKVSNIGRQMINSKILLRIKQNSYILPKMIPIPTQKFQVGDSISLDLSLDCVSTKADDLVQQVEYEIISDDDDYMIHTHSSAFELETRCFLNSI